MPVPTCGCELDDDELGYCRECGGCEMCCECDELFDADELGLDPETDDERKYPNA